MRFKYPFRMNNGKSTRRSKLFLEKFTQIGFRVVNITWKLNMFRRYRKLER